YMIRAQSPEASFRGRNQVALLKISREYFRRKKYSIPPASNRIAHYFFSAVRFRRVYKPSPNFYCRSNRIDASLVVPGTESDFGHTNACFSHLFCEHGYDAQFFQSLGGTRRRGIPMLTP